jgi:hypothetical protein
LLGQGFPLVLGMRTKIELGNKDGIPRLRDRLAVISVVSRPQNFVAKHNFAEAVL